MRLLELCVCRTECKPMLACLTLIFNVWFYPNFEALSNCVLKKGYKSKVIFLKWIFPWRKKERKKLRRYKSISHTSINQFLSGNWKDFLPLFLLNPLFQCPHLWNKHMHFYFIFSSLTNKTIKMFYWHHFVQPCNANRSKSPKCDPTVSAVSSVIMQNHTFKSSATLTIIWRLICILVAY